VRILLIEDDEILADRLADSLTQQQYVVDAIADGQDGLDYAQAANYDLIISDVGLPTLDGIALCRQLRNGGSSTPILLMTAKDAPDERIRGLDAGADDYLTKPLNLEELHARVRALLRRGEVIPETILQAGLLRLDPVSCQVTYDEKLLKLTPKEYSLLELFMRSPNRVFSRSHIIEHLWSFDDPPLEDSVKAHIKGLRRKLKQAGAQDWVENVYGLGYRFAPDESFRTKNIRELTSQENPEVSPQVESTDNSPDSSQTEQIYKDSLRGLWNKYQDLMAGRIDALTQAGEAIQSNGLTPGMQAEATRAAHKLAGVLGMFDLDEGSDLARDIETRLGSDVASEREPLPDLIQQLVDLIQKYPADASSASGPGGYYFLLVSPEPSLAHELQGLNQFEDISWHYVTSIAEAETTIQQAPPVLVVLDIAAASQWAASIEFVQHLSANFPSVPTLALTTTDSLIDRVGIAQAGIDRLLTKPVSAAQVRKVATELQRVSKGITADILVVDDDPMIARVLRSLLEPWGLGVTGLENPQEFWDLLNTIRPDLLILDVEMPEFSGIELCQAVRTDPNWHDLPILFLTAHRDSDTVQAVFRAGGDDYIAKPIVGPELVTRILNRQERNRLLHLLSRQDPTTQLWNYSYSRQALTRELQVAQAESLPLSLAIILLDDLASINLRYGHDAGYMILQTWGQCFQGLLPGEALAGYWGNGEFVIGLPNYGQAEAEEVLQSLFQTLRRQIITLPIEERIQPYFISAIVTFPDQGQTLKTLYQSAVEQIQAD
jgi:diguanylate cyclase (GGDEF)-like protein